MTDTEKKPNRRDAAKARTRERVVSAARTLFAADGGYAAATIRSIATEAGMSTGAVFANFSDKRAVYRTIYGHDPISPEQGRELVDLLNQIIDSDLSKAEASQFLFSHNLRSNNLTDLKPCNT